MERRDASSTNADWMSQLPEELWGTPLWDLAIPGSHDSMSYCLDTHSPVLGSESFMLQFLDRLAPCIVRPCVYRWATTQEALSTMAVWLEQHQKEVVILSCSHFYLLTDSEHQALVCYITQLFKDKLCPPQETPYLSQCWDLGQQVIISYDDETILHQHKQLWPKIPYWYADSADPKEVISYLEERQKAQGRAAHFFTSGLNLTEDTAVVVCNPCLTMRKLTMKSFSLLLDWVEKQTPGPNQTAVNIICGDFVGLNHFASVVIGLNKKLLKTESHR
ncbi:PI-PLC X domain-containing protein 1 isoform X2 [Oncorhynchus mykiss]|uniref:PI-PLC X domain-containing protein 1 isoform X2 n=1 Tax=Oncorhynchus mykiss TaxID=8022 RepID=UPI001877DCF4|nr:PI-PLC X domain-containing protein 1 isoform X2 [Oncorhynchus mykiss]XP_036838174.1 PI-PLC X domain-containing protein 1 isoform X2 [Oncorhynchus mykiss]